MILPKLASALSFTNLTESVQIRTKKYLAAFLGVLRYQDRGGKRNVVTEGESKIALQKFQCRDWGTVFRLSKPWCHFISVPWEYLLIPSAKPNRI